MKTTSKKRETLVLIFFMFRDPFSYFTSKFHNNKTYFQMKKKKKINLKKILCMKQKITIKNKPKFSSRFFNFLPVSRVN